MADLYLMAGCPGSGKSTFLKNHINENTSIIVSRDEIRFSLVKPEENYFSREDEVLDQFWEDTNNALEKGKTVYADQTSLTPKARKWFLQHVFGYDNVYLIWVDEDLDTCHERNEMRQGTRAYVPKKVIHRMHAQFIEPSLDEGFNKIYRYNSKKGSLIEMKEVSLNDIF